MKHYNRISVAVSIILITIMTFSLLIALLPRLLGMSLSIVDDDKMATTYPNGSLLFIKKVEPTDIYVGDVISYYVNQGESIKTRRVVAIEKNQQAFYAKGDSQDQMEIGVINSRNLIGQPKLHIPYLGLLVSDPALNLLKYAFGFISGILTLTTIWLMVEPLKILNKQKRSKLKL